MIKLLNLYTTQYGYILANGIEKYVMNKSKQCNSDVPYYLKKVEPNEEYFTGLFYDKKYSYYKGKCKDGRRVKVKLGMNTAELNIY